MKCDTCLEDDDICNLCDISWEPLKDNMKLIVSYEEKINSLKSII